MIKGLLDSKVVYIREGKVAESLKRVDPQTYARTSNNTVDRRNHHALGFGHKLHLDQNEKLVMFGVTHVLAADCYSGMIVSHVTMPIKNNLLGEALSDELRLSVRYGGLTIFKYNTQSSLKVGVVTMK